MQVVCDPNVLVSAAVTPEGVCAQLLETLSVAPPRMIVSPLLLEEVQRVLARPRFETPPALLEAFGAHIRHISLLEPDPPSTVTVPASVDPKDDSLIRLTLASSTRLLVTGDRHLLDLAGTVPVVTARELLDALSG